MTLDMERHGNNPILESPKQPPLLVIAFLQLLLRLLTKRPRPSLDVDWRETATEVGARFLVGLVIGVGLCVLLVPVVFWPSRRVPRSLFEQMGEPGWIGWLFLGVLGGTAFLWALTTRVRLRNASISDSFAFPGTGADLEDRTKTGCMGLLIPLALVAYGVYRITHPWKRSRFTGTWKNPEDVAALGICALGIALCVHALGFVPYERVPLLKWLLAAAGVAVFIYGLFWPMAGR